MKQIRTKSFEAIKLLEIRKSLELTQARMAKLISCSTGQVIQARHIGMFENNDKPNSYKYILEYIEEWVVANWKMAEKYIWDVPKGHKNWDEYNKHNDNLNETFTVEPNMCVVNGWSDELDTKE